MHSKIIRDIVHGYIHVTSDDLQIIDHPLFQRLLRIRQGLNSFAYPSLNHNRFEHSLGVMCLGTQVFGNIVKEITDVTKKEALKKREREVRYACLLHDIGHGPFSHVGESFYDKNWLVEEMCNLRGRDYSKEYEEAAPHELMSSIIILKNDEIKKILTDKLGLDIKFIADMICGIWTPYIDSPDFAVLQILYSSIDVDKLDYVLRDNKMAGGDFLSLDVPRFVKAYSVTKENYLALNYGALSSVINLIYGRSNVYMWIINHHRNVLTNGLITEYIEELINSENSGVDINIGDKSPIKFKDFFSYDGIVKHFIDDCDLIKTLKNNRDFSKLGQVCYKHFCERGNLTPIWKTGIEFDKFLDGSPNKIRNNAIRFTASKDKSIGHLDEVENIINRTIGQSLRSKEDFFIFKCQDKHYEPFALTESASPRDTVYVVLRNGNYAMVEDIYETTPIKTCPTYPFFYLDKNSVYADVIKKSLSTQ